MRFPVTIHGGYLDEVSINLDPQGNLKFSSSAKPLTMQDDTVSMLGKSMVQAKEGTPKQIAANLRKLGLNVSLLVVQEDLVVVMIQCLMLKI